jgi:uncharacterized protein (TIGR00725 family)
MGRALIAVIGIGDLEDEDPIYRLAMEVGRIIIDEGFRLVTGGLGGVMEAASRGARSSEKYHEGDIVGILPGADKGSANRYVDVPIPTGLGIARNMIITNSDAVIAVGGGSGTLSEIAFAWQKGKLVIAMDVEGWSGKVAGTRLDPRIRNKIPDDRIYSARTANDARSILKEQLPLYQRANL